MELRAYLNILWQERATILVCTLTTVIAAYLFTLNQPEIYQATASYVMRPRAALIEDEQDSVRVLDTLGRQVSIGSTYVQVASSRLIRRRAIESLALSPEAQSNLTIDGEAVAGTNMLRISAQGPNRVVVQEFANQVGVETVAYVSDLYDIFELVPLDAATTPRNPISPNLILNLVLGAFVGMALGTGIALLMVYWRTPHTAPRHFDIVDAETGAYNVQYFRLRLRQEVSRARRRGESFSIALIRISRTGSPIDSDVLRRAAIFLQTDLRDEDLLAYTGDAVFAILLVGLQGELAKVRVEELCNRLQGGILLISEDARLWDVTCSAGVSSFEDAEADADDLWSQCVLALTDVNMSRNGKVSLYSQLEGIFAPTQPLKRAS